MKSLFVVLCFCFIFSPKLKTVHGSSRTNSNENSGTSSKEDSVKSSGTAFYELRERLGANVTIINEALEISPSGFLGDGTFALVYKGTRISDSREVAVKFLYEPEDEYSENEYKMYWYLEAIDNPGVERYGIPSVYYYGNWEDFIVMAITLCEKSVENRKSAFVSPINVLIVFQQFVRQSKYIHSRGIRHNDIKADNIMLKSYQTFLIDFNVGSKMHEDTHLCTDVYQPRRSDCWPRQIRKAVDDWESFFYGMAEICNVPLKWFADEYHDIANAKRDTQDILNKVMAIESVPLREVFHVFFLVIFTDKATDYPNYNDMDTFISERIRKVLGRQITPNEPAYFDWMDEVDIIEAWDHIELNPIPNIRTEISFPMVFNYPDVDVNYFNGTAEIMSKRLFSEVATSSSNSNTGPINYYGAKSEPIPKKKK